LQGGRGELGESVIGRCEYGERPSRFQRFDQIGRLQRRGEGFERPRPNSDVDDVSLFTGRRAGNDRKSERTRETIKNLFMSQAFRH
jgi:hypothetical protein